MITACVAAVLVSVVPARSPAQSPSEADGDAVAVVAAAFAAVGPHVRATNPVAAGDVTLRSALIPVRELDPDHLRPDDESAFLEAVATTLDLAVRESRVRCDERRRETCRIEGAAIELAATPPLVRADHAEEFVSATYELTTLPRWPVHTTGYRVELRRHEGEWVVMKIEAVETT